MTELSPLPTAIPEMFAQISTTGKITVADRYGLMAAILDNSTTEEELHLINRLLHALRRGRVQIVDELSAFP